ncbi:MAG: hypothetical protein HZC36_13580 [Armatimonadetes bacterium]|nr:hypothetical protein [Armatimonadota bacterium]
MALRINSNVSAMNALRNLQGTQDTLGSVVERLSTGLRINTASDDPAGLIISENMRTQLKGIEQAIRNSQDAVNMSKTAEGALDEVQLLLRNIRALAVHSANAAVVDSATLQANQTQIRSTIDSINRIAEHTQFGQKKLLDGSAGILANITSVDDVSSIFVGGTFAGVNGHTFSSNGTETLQQLVTKINALASTTGVTAAITGSGPVSVQLTQVDYGAQHSIQFFDASSILHTSSSASSTGVDAVFNVAVTTVAGVTTVPFTGGRGPGESGLKLMDNYGNTIQVTEGGNASMTSATNVGQVTAGSVRFQIGGNSNQAAQFSMPVVFANRLGTSAVTGMSLADLDVTTQSGAQNAMRIIDDAIEQLSQLRGSLGSFQKNFLESNIRSLSVAQENMTSSESQVRDADMAEEITAMTRLQILNQSGMAVLAQANQMPKGVLQLLQG